MKNESDNPALVPFDDRNPAPEKLFHTPSEMSDEQFALLAAAWAEGGLDDESLSEVESIFRNDPDREIFAKGFKKIRLMPGREKWDMRDSLLRTDPYTLWARRGVITLLATAAAVALFIALKPLLNQSDTLLPASEKSELQIAFAKPVYKMKYYPPAAKEPVIDTKKTVEIPDLRLSDNEMTTENLRTPPLVIKNIPEYVSVRQQVNISFIEQPKVIAPSIGTEADSEQNWIVRGMLAVADLIKKDDRPIDGYDIAGACVKGVNNALGWEMELEKVMAENGKPVAVSFSSSLLSFRSPVKKNSDEQ